MRRLLCLLLRLGFISCRARQTCQSRFEGRFDLPRVGDRQPVFVGKTSVRPQGGVITGAKRIELREQAIAQLRRCLGSKRRHRRPDLRVAGGSRSLRRLLLTAVQASMTKPLICKWRLKHRAIADAWRKPATVCSPSPACRRANGAARTTNAIERLHEEFKRRIKTQTVLPSADMLFWALLASGQINMRKIDGWQTIATKPFDHAGFQQCFPYIYSGPARSKRFRTWPIFCLVS